MIFARTHATLTTRICRFRVFGTHTHDRYSVFVRFPVLGLTSARRRPLDTGFARFVRESVDRRLSRDTDVSTESVEGPPGTCFRVVFRPTRVDIAVTKRVAGDFPRGYVGRIRKIKTKRTPKKKKKRPRQTHAVDGTYRSRTFGVEGAETGSTCSQRVFPTGFDDLTQLPRSTFRGGGKDKGGGYDQTANVVVRYFHDVLRSRT